MALPSVHIDRWAFFNILIAVTEVFKQESIGHLFGFAPTATKNYFRIVNAFPLQHLRKRGFADAEQSKKSDRLLTEMLSGFQGIQIQRMGGFHSHPEYGSVAISRSLSDTDMQMMAENNYDLEIVVTISTAKRPDRSTWQYTSNGAVIGYHSGLRYVVDAFLLVGKPIRNNVRKLKIRTPSAMRSLRRLHHKQ